MWWFQKAPLDTAACAKWLEQIPWIVTVTNSAVLISLVWLVHYLGFFLLVGTATQHMVHCATCASFSAPQRRKPEASHPLAGLLFPWRGRVGHGDRVGIHHVRRAGHDVLSHPKFSASRSERCAGARLCVLIVQRKLPVWDRAPCVPATAKWLAFASLALWIGAILAGLEVTAFIPGI